MITNIEKSSNTQESISDNLNWRRLQYRMVVVLRPYRELDSINGNYIHTVDILKRTVETHAEMCSRLNGEVGKWAILDATTQRLIVTSFDEQSLNHMINCTTMEGEWNKSLSVYEQNSDTSSIRSHQFYSYIVGPVGNEASSDVPALRHLTMDMTTSGPVPSDIFLMSKILTKLLNDYRHVHCNAYLYRMFNYRDRVDENAARRRLAMIDGFSNNNARPAFVLNSTEKWYVDSGASDHMCRHKGWFVDYVEFENSKLREVQMGNGMSVTAYGKGNVRVIVCVGKKKIIRNLTEVLYTPKMKVNLFSVSACLDMGIKFIWYKKTCKLIKNGKVFAVGKRVHRLFTMKFKTIVANNDVDNN